MVIMVMVIGLIMLAMMVTWMAMMLMLMTTMVVILMILRVSYGDGDAGNSVDGADYDAGNDGDVDGHHVEVNDNDCGDFNDSACQ